MIHVGYPDMAGTAREPLLPFYERKPLCLAPFIQPSASHPVCKWEGRGRAMISCHSS